MPFKDPVRNKEYRREYAREYMREWHRKNPEKSKAIRERRKLKPDYYLKGRNWDLKRHYGPDAPERYEAMFRDQSGRCAICGTDDPGGHEKGKHPRSFAMDHDHKTGRLRGLLCSVCNRALGGFKDDPERLMNAANYIRKYVVE